MKAEYDIGSSALRRWVRVVHENGSTRAADNRTPEQQRILEPGEESKRLQMEVGVR